MSAGTEAPNSGATTPVPVDSKLKEIPLRQIRESKIALRDVDKDDEKYIHLVDSVRKDGVMNAIVVREMGKEDGEMIYSLIDGLQRFTASCDAGRETIPANIIKKTDGEVLEAQIIANIQRIDTKPYQYSDQLQKVLSANPMMTLAQLAGRLSVSSDWLDNRLGLTKLTPDIGKLVDEGNIPLSNAYVLAKLPPEEQPNWVERAITQQPVEFAQPVNARVKELKDAKREGRSPKGEEFVAVAHCQKLADLKAELETPNALVALIGQIKPKNPLEAAQLTLKWVLHLDDISVAAAKEKYETERKQRTEDKAKRDKEKTTAKALAAKKLAAELLQKAEGLGIDLNAEQAKAEAAETNGEKAEAFEQEPATV